MTAYVRSLPIVLLLWAVLSVSVVAAPDHVPQVTDRTWVIAFGCNAYRNLEQLHFAAQDAASMAGVFKANGVPERQVTLISDLNGSQGQPEGSPPVGNTLRQTLLDTVSATLQMARKGDTVVLFFACHGIVNGDQLYLVPSDGDPTRLPETALSLDTLRGWLTKSAATDKVLLLDVCHAAHDHVGGHPTAPLPSTVGRPAPPRQAGWADYFGDLPGFYVLASCRDDEVSHEYPQGKQGWFTYWLKEGLEKAADRNNDREITVDELYQYVFDRMTDPQVYRLLNVTSARPNEPPQTPVRSFKGGNPVVSVVGGRQVGGVWRGTRREGNAGPTGSTSHFCLVIDQRQGTSCRGLFLFKFGYDYAPFLETPLEGTWDANNHLHLKGPPNHQLDADFDPQTQMIVLKGYNVGQFRLEKDEGLPQVFRPNQPMVLNGATEKKLQVRQPGTTPVQLNVTECKLRKESGEVGLLDLTGELTGTSPNGQAEPVRGVAVGSSVFLQAGRSSFVGGFVADRLEGTYWNNGRFPMFLGGR